MSKLWWYLCFFVVVVLICDDLVALKSKQIKVTDKYSRFKQRKWFLITDFIFQTKTTSTQYEG